MERKIGEVFQDGEVTLKCVESKGCNGCNYVYASHNCVEQLCSANDREDNTQVIFTQIIQ